MTTATADSQSQDTGKKPSHIAYTTRQRGEKTYWNACGAAWSHKDGKGFRIKLDALQVSGVIELRINDPKAPNDNSLIDWSNFSDCEDQ